MAEIVTQNSQDVGGGGVMQMTLIAIAPLPTKAYIKSLFKSENLVCNADHIEMCQDGWRDAAHDTDEIRRACLPGLWHSWCSLRDAYALGYVTYVYAYTSAMKAEVE